MTANAINVSNLGKVVRLPGSELRILQDVSFTIHLGKTAAIVGASGSGKSTLLSLMAGLDTPSEGYVEILDTRLSSLDEDGRAKLRGDKVGFVFQSFQLLPALTAIENVMLPLELRGDSNPQAAARDILQRVGLGERLQHYPRQLSGGEQQRVAIARAFVVKPSVLFADEPTGNLDTETGRAIADLLFELNRTSGTTLVVVTHDEKLAARCSDILRLSQGRLQA
jgi:putative ABC transport system ATP-binding protein